MNDAHASRSASVTYLTARILDQSAKPVLRPFCSLVRPCTASIWQPASCNMRANLTVRSTQSNTRILQNTGIDRFCRRVSTSGEHTIVRTPTRIVKHRHIERGASDTHRANQHPILISRRQEGAVVSTVSNVLRASEVDIDGVARVLDLLRCQQQILRVVATKLPSTINVSHRGALSSLFTSRSLVQREGGGILGPRAADLPGTS